jgi:benzoyl-CoA reductase/2-hydroxyglutaryl-CoA dehydratase subunit BcrC/BadD/HgdB
MMKSGIDQQALVDMFSQASAQQGEALRQAVSTATLKAMQGRELTLANIRKVLKTVTEAASAGAAQNQLSQVDPAALLTQAFEGMDRALLQAVEANRKALQQFVDQGAGLQEKQLKAAISNLEKMEDMLFDAVAKGAQATGQPLAGPWDQVLGAMKVKGTGTGQQAEAAVTQLVEQTRSALRDSRAIGMRATQAMLDSYAALVSGVLIGMSQGLQGDAPVKPAAAPRGKR